MNRSCFFLALLAGWGFPLVVSAAVTAQSIVPGDDTGTIVRPNGSQQTLIQGGKQAGNNLFHQFQRFDVSAGQSANFSINPTVGNIFSRVTGGQASLINGTLQVSGGNANLFLLNPAGVIFGQSARLDLPGSFVATTAEALEFDRSRWLTSNTINYAGLTGAVTGYGWLSPTPGSVINAGNLAVQPGQSVMLSGGTVVNTGTISAPAGNVTIAAVPGEKVLRVSQTNQILSLDLPLVGDRELQALPKPPKPESLPELLAGRDAAEATGLTIVDDKVQLASSAAPIALASNQSIISGAIAGNAIDITGERIALQAADIQASQPQGGGTMRIGGDYQGQGDMPRAQQVQIDGDSRLQADATIAGNGGKIIVWSDGHTQFAGEATARGKGIDGNGGLVETSGKQTLDVSGARVNASAPQGEAGEWLLDPTDINIANGGAGVPTAGTFDPATTGAASVIAPGTIAAALDGGTNVTITTAGGTGGNGDITLSNSINQSGGGSATLTLTGRRFNRVGGAQINLNSDGDLTFNINQVNPETTAPTASIQNAIDTIGTVAGGRRINLGAGLYQGGAGFALVNVNKDVTLTGASLPGSVPASFIDGNLTTRPIFITAGTTATLRNLGIQNGVTAATESGGGILNSGRLTLEEVVLFNNRAGLDGGGIDSSSTDSSLVMVNTTLINNRAGVDGGGAFLSGNTQYVSGGIIGNQAGNNGGGIYNQGNLTISLFRMSNNRALDGGGIYNTGAGATVTATDFLFDRNDATNASGGGIFNQNGTINLLRGTLANNTATTRGGGIFSNGGNINLQSIGLDDNQAGRFGAGILLDNAIAVIEGTGFRRNIAIEGGGGINLDGTSQLSLNLSTLMENRGQFGGGINTNPTNGPIVISQSLFDGNQADFGGGILNQTNISIDRSTFQGNIANFVGGAIDNTGATARLISRGSVFANNQAGSRGGAVNSSNGGTVDVIASIFQGNQAAGDGGAIRSSDSTLTIDRSTFSNNTAQFGGAIELSATGNAQIIGSTFQDNVAIERGGAIQNDGATLNITGSFFDRNRATLANGGAIQNYSALTVANSNFEANQANLDGGAISSNSILTVNASTFLGNIANRYGAGIDNRGTLNVDGTLFINGQSIAGSGIFNSSSLNVTNSFFDRNIATRGITTGDGAAIYNLPNSSLTVNSSTFQNNQAEDFGGAIGTNQGAVSIANSQFVNNQSAIGGGLHHNSGSLSISGTQFLNNQASQYGGGLDLVNLGNATVQQTLIQGNQSGDGGGGIALSGTSDLTLDQVTIDSNQARRGAGLDGTLARNYSGILNIFNSMFSNNQTTLENGGGIDINPISNPFNATNIYDSTFSGNRAVDDGGAIAVGLNAAPNLVNVTIENNQANRDGGGILSYGNFRLNNVTIANNQADADGDGMGTGGGAFNSTFGPFQSANTIIAKNRVANNQTGSGTDISGDFIDQGNNLIGIADGATGFSNSTLVGNSSAPIDPLLSPLGNYGGLTATMALLPGSRAIDAGNSTIPADQRGIGRVNAPDIGAFESRGFVISSTSGSGQSTVINTAFSAPLQLSILSPFNEPVDGGQINFTAPTSGSSLTLSSNPQPITIVGGIAMLPATANAIAGVYTINGSAVGLPTTVFTLGNTLPPPVITPPSPPVITPPVVTPPSPPTATNPIPDNLPIYPVNPISYTAPEAPSLSNQLQSLDETFSQDYINQFGTQITTQKPTEAEIGNLLTNLDQKRGLRSAVIYAMFVPQVFTPEVADNDDAKSAAIPSLLRATERRDDDRLELIFITGEGKLYRRSTPYQRREVEESVTQFRLINSDIENADSAKAFGQQLQQWLFNPVQQDLENAKVNGLMYVLDHGLRSLPIAAMRDEKQALIERYSMAVIPSLGMLDRQQTILRSQTTLAAGASKFTELAALPAVPDELAMIQRQGFPGPLLLNEGFTIANLKQQQQAMRPGILHLATHADFHSGDPSNSAIQFFDRPLLLSEINQLNFRNSNLELLILSACNTATGDPNAELGFTGMASLLGVRTALGSLWSISDIGTYAFMSEFYGHLAKTPSRSETLRLTQLAMQQGQVRIEQGHLITSHSKTPLPKTLANQTAQTFNHPYFWSGFTMVGNPW
ncbi:MAG: hypothetical protein RLZZ511_281 [Cyanobacteriota bacterium]|jgi:filamentous hemagglutinin family protein